MERGRRWKREGEKWEKSSWDEGKSGKKVVGAKKGWKVGETKWGKGEKRAEKEAVGANKGGGKNASFFRRAFQSQTRRERELKSLPV